MLGGKYQLSVSVCWSDASQKQFLGCHVMSPCLQRLSNSFVLCVSPI
jgi:hypothetical protein